MKSCVQLHCFRYYVGLSRDTLFDVVEHIDTKLQAFYLFEKVSFSHSSKNRNSEPICRAYFILCHDVALGVFYHAIPLVFLVTL